MTSDSQPPQGRLTTRGGKLRHIENTRNRSGPEVVAALNRSLRFFEDLHLARGEMAQLCYIPTFQQSFYMYVTNTGDPEVDAKIERVAKSRARSSALLLKSDEEYDSSAAEGLSLKVLSIERRKALGHAAVPRQPPAPLQKRMKIDVLQELAQKAASGIFEPSDITVVPVQGSLKKLKSFRVYFPAGPLLKVFAVLEFDRLAVWSVVVLLTRPDMLPAPLTTFMDISPASDFAWPTGMATETRIACFLRAIALFAQQIGQQTAADDPKPDPAAL